MAEPIHLQDFKADFVPSIKRLELFAKQSILSKDLVGNWVSLFKGKGMEFAGYRPYVPTDDASRIDWKATLRARRTLVREKEEERTLKVMFFVDASNSMLFTSTDKIKVEYVAEMIAAMSFAMVRTGDSVGLAMFTNRLVNYLPAQTGQEQFRIMIKELSDPKNYGGMYNIDQAFNVLLSSLDDKALIIIVSDFLGLKGEWEKHLKIASASNEVLGIMIRDPRDRQMPKGTGQYVLEDPYSGEKAIVDANQYRDFFERAVTAQEEEIATQFKRTRSDFLSIQTNESFVDPIVRFFKRRSFTGG